MSKSTYAYFFITLCIINNNDFAKSPHQQPQQQQVIIVQQAPQEEDIDTTPLVLQNFGGVVLSFLSMLQDPKNPEHVVPCIKDMINGMINVVHVGFKRGYLETSDYYTQLEKELTAFFLSEQGQEYLYNLQHNIMQQTGNFVLD